MPKAHWIARIDVADLEQYKKYVAANAAAFTDFGAKFLVRAGAFETMEGSRRRRKVVIEFPSDQAAKDCDQSPAYQAAMALRRPLASGDLSIVEGCDGPQPG